ncbi:Zf-FLZ domain containing protein [Trema orientale]|uniref:Zf-FLZ domain containing protein n=1 Tax=Trema orientale TaxID=63057 RepID=A0A2P5FWI6_TREOI|nr:Zf-FLZ domain containing protein [Trema orientale]
MLRKRSRATTTTKQAALMADYTALPSPTENYRKPISSFFSSPRLFTSFSSKGSSETEAVMSPTSILDSNKPFSNLKNPFSSEPNININSLKASDHHETKRPWDKLDSKGVGLGIVDALSDEKSGPKPSKPETRMVLFGSHLKIQIPPLPLSVLPQAESPKSPGDFGIKTRNSQLGFSPFGKSASGSASLGLETSNSPRVFTGSLSATEMELSEDYTCVITHGPNPRTTHIFDNCIVESPGGSLGFSSSAKKDNNNNIGFVLSDRAVSYPSGNFLSCCYTCKKNLGQGKDIYMYRGEKAFCSHECRYEEMLLEEGADKLESDGV